MFTEGGYFGQSRLHKNFSHLLYVVFLDRNRMQWTEDPGVLVSCHTWKPHWKMHRQFEPGYLNGSWNCHGLDEQTRTSCRTLWYNHLTIGVRYLYRLQPDTRTRAQLTLYPIDKNSGLRYSVWAGRQGCVSEKNIGYDIHFDIACVNQISPSPDSGIPGTP